MLRLNKLCVEIKAPNKTYSFEKSFSSGLNFIASDNNTKGKSSILIAIYYCLGFEEIIGGTNEKVLTSVYKSKIDDGDTTWPVLQSDAYLEISNGNDVVTIYRTAKKEGRDTRLVTVFFSELVDIYSENVNIEEYYVHMPNAATSIKGFHTFLENFLGMELPLVPAADNVDRKLYLQLIFSAMFIEQKNGWSGIYSGMPYLSIKDSKKRVTEYILGLNTFENERSKSAIFNKERSIKERWRVLYQELLNMQAQEQCIVQNVPSTPEIISEDIREQVIIIQAIGERASIADWIQNLQEECDTLRTVKPRVIDNYDELQNELQKVEIAINDIDEENKKNQLELLSERNKISELSHNLEVIKQDIFNNKDAERLQKLGSELECSSFKGICPICNQTIQDSLLPIQHQTGMMSIQETIRHLVAQKNMFEFALKSHKNKKEELDSCLQELRTGMMELYRLAKSLRRDLFSVDEDLSETIIYKRMSITRKIEDLSYFKIEVDKIIEKIILLGEEWKQMLITKESIPKNTFTDEDNKKLNEFKNKFTSNLRAYRYTSFSNITSVEISNDNYLPVVDNFDMKFDSSASDNIRAIWAYTVALLQTSNKLGGNHPGILVFDEPAQHSIGADDAKAFFDSIIEIASDCQVIIGITVNTIELKNTIKELGDGNYNFIHIGEKAFM